MRRAAFTTVLLLTLGLLVLWCWDDAPPPPNTGLAANSTTAAVDAAGHADSALATAAVGERALDADAATRSATAAIDPFAHSRTGYRGRIVTATGTPVPGMRVRLFRGAPDVLLLAGLDAFATAPPEPQLEAARATTAADGRFRLGGIAGRGICWLRLEWPVITSAPPHLRAGDGTVIAVQSAPQPGEEKDLGDLVLKQGAVLTGRVVDDRGDPIALATVRAMRLPNLPFSMFPIERLTADDALFVTANGVDAVVELPPWAARVEQALPLCRATTAADGSFTLYGVDPGQNVVALTHPGHLGVLKQGVQVVAATHQDLGETALQDGEETTVLVREPGGQPIADAEVLVAGESLGLPVHLGERMGSTNAQGTLAVTGLPRGRALAAARRSPKEPWILGKSAPSGAPLEVVLAAHHSLLLRVLLPDGKPCSAPKLQFARGNRDQMAVELQMLGMRSQLDLAARVQSLPDGRVRIADVPAGSWTVLVTARNCGIESLQVEVTGDADLSVQLRAARTAQVHVLDAAGEPVEGAALYVQPRGGARAQRILEVPTHAGTTDREGLCTLRDLPTDMTKVTAEHPQHGQVHQEVQGLPEHVHLQFQAAGSIHGILTDGGRPPMTGRWVAVLERRYSKEQPRGAMPDLPQLQLPALDGSFTFGAIQPGSWRVTVQDAMTDVGTIGGIYDYMARRKQILPWTKADVELHSGETLSVRIDAMLDTQPYSGSGADIRGVVTIDGRPGEGALVVGTSTPSNRRTTSRVDRAGTFDLGRCPEGALRVVVVPKDVAESRLLENLFSHQFARDLTVVNEQSQELQIDVVTASVRGEVRDRSGAPVADCRVWLHDRGGAGRSSALRSQRTDGRGAFLIAQLPLGAYELRAEKDSAGTATSQLVVDRAAEFGPITIELVPLGRVRGQIDPKSLVDGRGAILLLPDAAQNTVKGNVDRDGRYELRNVPLGQYRVVLETGPAAGTPAVIGTCEVSSAEPVVVRTSLDRR
jgi:protocatechuate 3,4-dioxygenase beta subunit